MITSALARLTTVVSVALACALSALPDLIRSPAPAPAAATPPPPAALHRGQVFLFESAAGWALSWSDFDRDNAGFVDPTWPSPRRANMRYYFERLADKAVRMGADGVVFTTPHVRAPAGSPDTDMRFQGRLDALRAGSGVANRTAILEGLVALRLRFAGEVILYAGAPDRADTALALDRDYCDGIVKASIGPYLDTGYIDAVIFDSMGDRWSRAECRAVVASVRRNWPRVRIGGEPHPINFAGHPFTASFSTRESVRTGNVFGVVRVPVNDRFAGPALVGYTSPGRVDLADALEQVRLGRCVAVQPWAVGYAGEPSPADRAAWDAFIAEARSIRAGAMAAPAPRPLPQAPVPVP